MIGRLYKNFSIYFSTFSAPTTETLFLFVLSILAMESADSIRSLYKHFLAGITSKSLNEFCYACSYAKVDCSEFMNVTAKLALRLIPDDLGSRPVFICIDDTMVSKSGRKFEDVSNLFKHTAHNGFNCLNGHCFVTVSRYGTMVRYPILPSRWATACGSWYVKRTLQLSWIIMKTLT